MISDKNKKLIPAEHRKYLRLDTVFPVQFRLEGAGKNVYLSEWLQGFTNNISRGGICLAVNYLDPELFELIKARKVRLSLEIDIPISKKPVPARASIIWVQETFGNKHQYLIGISYEEIPPDKINQLMRYGWFKKLFTPAALALVVILAALFGSNSYVNYKLIQNNKQLIARLSAVLQETDLAKQKSRQAAAQSESFALKLKILQGQIKSVQSQKEKTQAGDLAKIRELGSLIDGLVKEKLLLETRLAAARRQEELAAQELIQIDEKKLVLEKANFDRMYQWLKIHQNARTGLVSSFEGDPEIANWSFTYDLALLIQAYTLLGDFDHAAKILDFFAHEAKRENGWFLNAYYVGDGAPAEFILHSGPNLWVGLAIMQYLQHTGDRSYLNLAMDIAAVIMQLQDADPAGGLRGGPQVAWYSTEHNLDAYAFFNMLHKVTQKPVYAQAAQRILNWMVSNTYDRQDLPVKRGRGDATIATDTYAWSIAAVGPEKLLNLGMDPDKIIEFVEENCQVEADFRRSGHEPAVKIKGFDFAPQRHTARGGLVSSEWTAQMVVSYRIMEDFYRRKGDQRRAADYSQKAQMYLGQLCQMIISSASPSGQGQGCLPYATLDQVDTGHGWFTPKGKHTGSVSGTAYTLFAYYGFNPLELKE